VIPRRSGPVSPIRLLQVGAFVATLDRFVMPPMLVAIAHDLGAPLSDVVRAAGVYFLVYGVSQVMWGVVSDRLGRVRTMRLTLFLAGLSTLGSALCGSVAALGLARGLAGGLFGAAYPSSLIYLGDTVPASLRQRDVARLMVGVAMGTTVGAVGAGIVADVTSWRLAFVATGAAAIGIAWALRALPEPRTDGRPASLGSSLRQVVHAPMVGLVLVFAFAEGAVLLGGLTLLPPAVEHTGASTAVAGAVTAVYGVSVFAFSRVVGRLSQRWHPSRLIALGATAAALACSVLVISQRPGPAVVAAGLIGIAWTAMHSSLQTWATEVLPGARATVVSLFATSLFVGSALAAVAFSGLADSGRYAVAFGVYAALAVPLGIGASWGRSRWQRPADPLTPGCNRVHPAPRRT
jgi:predicted MFS family arabinose efflux permease